MKIAIFNWRSITDPLSGGAEIVTLEHAKRWAKKENVEVIWICSRYKKNLKEEIIDNVKFVYLGVNNPKDSILFLLFSFPYFYLHLINYYLKNLKNKIDVVIDEVHGIPFLTPLYVKEKKILYIHEVADNIWDKMYPFPINKIGKFVEKFFLKFYKNIVCVTGSNSTKNDLINLGFDREKIFIVEHGIKYKPLSKPQEKFNEFTILFLNRIVKMKGPERTIDIFSKLLKKIPSAKLIMAGKNRPDYFQEIKDKAKKLNIFQNIDFKGEISEEEKIHLYQKSHVLINTSVKEGWGLVNIEANSQGTPVVASWVEGNQDSIKNGINGYLAKTDEEFVEKILILKDKNLESSSIEYSKNFEWDQKAEEFYKIIK
jgi:glycosyltransferase involved in cell wall biosynthesis